MHYKLLLALSFVAIACQPTTKIEPPQIDSYAEARAFLYATGKPYDLEKAETISEKACNDGDMRSCNLLAVVYLSQPYRPSKSWHAYKLFKKSCDAGNHLGCVNLSQRLIEGVTGINQDKKSADLLITSCEANCGAACSYLASYYLEGYGVAKDAEKAASIGQKARELFEQDCRENKTYFACGGLANNLSQQAGIPEDPTRAAKLFKEQCDKDNSSACNTLGYLFLYGTGVEKDNNLAHQYFTKACRFGVFTGNDACFKAAMMALSDEDPHGNLSTAKILLEKSCEAGHGLSCFKLSDSESKLAIHAKQTKRLL